MTRGDLVRSDLTAKPRVSRGIWLRRCLFRSSYGVQDQISKARRQLSNFSDAAFAKDFLVIDLDNTTVSAFSGAAVIDAHRIVVSIRPSAELQVPARR